MTVRIALLAAVLALPGVALGQTVYVEPAQEPEAVEETEAFKVQALAGWDTYTGSAQNFVDGGFGYGAALTVPASPLLGLEFAYNGATFQTDSDLPGDQERITENGAHGVVKVSPDIGGIEPYLFGGVGFNVLSAPDNQVVVNDDTFIQFPLGVGLDVGVPLGGDTELMLGARGSYELGVTQEAFTSPDADNPNRLRVMFSAGAEF